MNKIISIANTCKRCNNANCSKYCPIHTNIPMINSFVSMGKFDLATDVLFRQNPFPYVTSLLCDHEKQCFGNCIFKNVSYYNVENKLANEYFDKLIDYPSNLKDSNVIIIGGGITGLTVAHYLLKSGLKPTIYEKNKLGGVITSSIPSFRFDKTLFLKHINEIENHCNIIYQEVDENLLNSFDESTKVILTTGASIESKSLLSDNVYTGIDLLNKINLGVFDISNKKIGVIGLGNTACDVARSLKKLNNNVHIVYRRDIESSPASKKELESLICEGITINECLTPLKYENNILYLHKNKLIQKENEKRKSIIETDEEVYLEFDLIVEAIGSKPDDYLIKSLLKNDYLKYLEDKKIISDYYHYKNIYIGGDGYYGAWNIAKAIYSGRKIFEAICPTYIFGGSFNPITMAHSSIIDYVSGIGNLIIVPNGDRYQLKNLMNFNIRKEMIEIELSKLNKNHNITISEFERSTEYKGSIELLRYYNHPTMVIGDDCLYTMKTWIKAEQLIKENKFLVIARKSSLDEINLFIQCDNLFSKYEDNFEVIDILDDDKKTLSSSDFRDNLNIKNISKEVLEYIKSNKIYEV